MLKNEGDHGLDIMNGDGLGMELCVLLGMGQFSGFTLMFVCLGLSLVGFVVSGFSSSDSCVHCNLGFDNLSLSGDSSFFLGGVGLGHVVIRRRG